IIGPMLLELGVDPRAASATSSVAVFLNASGSTIQYAVMTVIAWDWALWFASVGLLATVFGLFVINRAVQKTNRASLIVISIILLMLAAAVMMVAVGIQRTVDDAEHGRSFGFRPFC